MHDSTLSHESSKRRLHGSRAAQSRCLTVQEAAIPQPVGLTRCSGGGFQRADTSANRPPPRGRYVGF
eukprot:766108-Amphidinium_carterae.2